ncbi:MAG: ABC transporter ATP-binding protein [Cyanophyceae cyanobacterium]
MDAVELRDVSKAYSHHHSLAVEQLNLQIAPHEFFSVLGPSGCGKTTTLRLIAGFEKPTAGEILISGQSMGDRPPFHRPVNTVFQSYALFPHLTVAQNVAFGLEMEQLPQRQIRQRVAEALQMVQLTGMEKRRPRQLSGGQQQRVALARAIVKQPQVLLLDEPLGALDLKLRKEMQLELKQMQKQLGITFVYVTHDQEEALTMSDRIAVLCEGRILQVGTPREIYEQPNTRFVAEFIGESNFLSGRIIERIATGVVVLVDNLPIPAAFPNDLPIGSFVTLAIRPEKIAIFPADYADEPCLLGKIEQSIYLGTDTRYVVRLTPRNCVIVRQQNLGVQNLDGENVKLKILPESVRILSELATRDQVRVGSLHH